MLDPEDWQAFRKQSHRMLDDMLDYLQHVDERKVWQQAPESVQQHFHTPWSAEGEPLAQLHQQFMQDILPYSVGNTHPGFMGWVHGGGTPTGMLADMLAAGLNANLGGRNQIPVDVEWQVLDWMRDLFAFPADSSGVLTSGTSAATLIALHVARQRLIEQDNPAVYISEHTHGCISRALRIMGMDKTCLQVIPCNAQYSMDTQALKQRIQENLQQGLTPWVIIGTVGSVHTGSVDDIKALAQLASAHQLWLHIDGAFGALAILSEQIAPRLQGVEHADSLAMDFHKWGQVPYDAGMVLIRDGALHRQCFASSDAYLQRENEGLAAHSPWPCDYGIDLSRGFRALKIWMTFKHMGKKRMTDMIEHCCALARFLAGEVKKLPDFTLMYEPTLNIVCFRYCGQDDLGDQASDTINRAIIRHIHLSGLAAPSLTYLQGRAVIRAAIVNHRTRKKDIGKLLAAASKAARVCTKPATSSHP